MKTILVIAGPNGSGKTTTAFSLLPDLVNIYECINADEIARGLAPLHPESMALTASKLMIKRLKDLLEKEKNFAFETTASGKNYIKYLKDAQMRGYEVNLVYLWLANADIAVERVVHRVAQGGHYIPEDVIRRQYKSGMKNTLHHYLPLADRALILDNSTKSQKVIARKSQKCGLKVENIRIWKKMQELLHD